MSALLVLAYLIGLHTEYRINVGSTPCTFFTCGVIGLYMLYRWRHHCTRAQVYTLAGISLVALSTVVFGPGTDLWVEGIKGWLQLNYSLVASYGLYLELSTWRTNTLCKLAGIGILVYLFGLTLEVVFPVFKSFSDTVRAIHAAKNVFLYSSETGGGVWSDLRDLELAGHLRPCLFALEPSHAAYSLVLLMMIWYGLSSMRFKQISYLCALGWAMYLTGSPTMLCAMGVLIATSLDDLLTPGMSRSAWYTKLYSTVALLVLIGVIANIFFGSRFSSRKEMDLSSACRTTLPYSIAWRALHEYPLFGLGLSEIEVYEDVVQREATNLAVDRGINGDPANGSILTGILCNSFCEIPLYFGIIGSLGLLFCLYHCVKHFGYHNGYCYTFIIMCALMNTIGALVSAKVWISLMLTQIMVRGRHGLIDQINTKGA